MEDELHDLATQHGFQINCNKGVYIPGKPHPKMEVAASLKASQKQNGGEPPNIGAVSRLCNMSWHFVHKIENEIDQHLSPPLS
jgi:hypothetical protein